MESISSNYENLWEDYSIILCNNGSITIKNNEYNNEPKTAISKEIII